MTSLRFIIVGTPSPPPPLLKGAESLGGGGRGMKFLLEWRGGRGATFLLLYSSVIFTVCEGKARFPLLLFGSSVLQDSDPTFYLLKPNIICTFLIHNGSVQKMLTAFFNFVWINGHFLSG